MTMDREKEYDIESCDFLLPLNTTSIKINSYLHVKQKGTFLPQMTYSL
jgi:hypothetical protein